MYLVGADTEKNIEESLYWHNRAAKNGHIASEKVAHNLRMQLDLLRMFQEDL